jgi:hypothetical protein
LRIGESKLIKCRVHVTSILEDGSVVLAKVSADGVDIDTRNNVAYSWRRAPRGMATHVSLGSSTSPAYTKHSSRWIWFVVLAALAAAAWFVIRARRGKPFA